MKKFFDAKSVAIVGVSSDPSKIGHVIYKNITEGDYKGKVHIVNKKGKNILNQKVYKSVKDIPGNVDLAVIVIPGKFVLPVMKDCAKKKIRNVVIVSAGFKEVGNEALENQLRDFMNKNKIKCIGVNCLGVLNVHNGLDTLFLPRFRMRRPRKGSISFLSQSGAVGSATLDLVGYEGYGVAKFISYGNATNVDEADLLEYLGDDKDTNVICLYVEGVSDGQKFLKVARKVSKKKPIIILKGGKTESGHAATLSHTGSLAGAPKVYEGAFKQAGVIEVDSLREMFNVAKVLDKGFKVKGNAIQVLTDGGGFGILAADEAERLSLEMPDLSKDAKKQLKKVLPPLASITNPLDVIGDADTERYRNAIEVCLKESQIDMVVVVLLYQVPRLGTDAVDMIIKFQKKSKKPIVCVSPGGDFTQSLKRKLESGGVPVFDFPEEAVQSLKSLAEYWGV